MQQGITTVSFSMSGTLGDAFTVFCKLAGYYKKTGNHINLYRYSQYPEFDEPLKKFFGQILYIEYITPSYKVILDERQLPVCEKMIAPHISSIWNGKNDPYFPADPPDVVFEAYPEIALSNINLPKDKFRIGIQLQTGKVNGNFKGFSLGWISKVAKLLQKDKYIIYLLGTGAGYSLSKIEYFCKKHNIKNLVGKTDFVEWMSYIKSMNFFITPEGFSAFFAMSQRVRSLVFYTDYQILGRVPSNWRRENIIISAGQESLIGRITNKICRETLSRNLLLKPLKPVHIYSLIHTEISYR